MSKVKKLSNRLIVFLIFLLSAARLAVARIWPFHPPGENAPSAKVFALTEAAWLELRAMDDRGAKSGNPNPQQAQNADDKKPTTPSGDENKDRAKSGDDKKADPSKPDCDASKSDDKKGGATPDKDGKKPPAKPCDPGPGGGDGDMGGTGG